jgi:hypothetical protein
MITADNIDLLKNIVILLEKKVKYFTGNVEISLGEEHIHLFIGEHSFDYSIPEFIEMGKLLEGFEIYDNGRIHTKGISYQIVKMEDSDLEHYLRKTESFYSVEEIAEISLIEGNEWVAFACLVLGSYHEFGVNNEEYSVVEIDYQDKTKILSFEDETNLIYSYLFEIADSTGHVYYLSEIQNYDDELHDKISKLYYNPDSEYIDDTDTFDIRPLLGYSEAMRLYVSALQTTDPELSLLNFYKIFEYFAPIVITIDSYDQLSKKLDSPKALKPDRAYLKSIFELVDSNRQKLRDGELIKSVINKCFDIVDIFSDLPESIQKKVLSNIKEKSFTYDIDKEKLIQACNYLGTILYSTRNQIVHAKSNFTPSGEECPTKDIKQFNIFLKKATALTIRWHNKLPDFQKE